MAPPASEAVIRLGSEGGQQTAQEINRTAGAMTELGKAVSGMTSEFNVRPDVSGWDNVGKEMAFTAVRASELSGGMQGLSKAIDQTRLEMGGLGLALDLVPGLGLVEAAVDSWTEREEALAEHLAKKNKELKTTIELVEEARKVSVPLTDAQEDLATLSAKMSKVLTDENIARKENQLEVVKQGHALTWFSEIVNVVLRQKGFGNVAERLLTNATRERTLAIKEGTANLEANKEGFADWQAMVKEATVAASAWGRTLQHVRDDHRSAREELEMMRDPAARYDIEAENIERVRQLQLASMTQSSNAHLEMTRKIIQDEDEKAMAVKRITQDLADARVTINETAATKTARAWERESERIAATNQAAASQANQDWKGATDAMGGHVKGFASGLSSQIGSSTLDAAASFKNMADAMVAQLIRVAVQMVVMKFIPGAAPIVSAAGGFQHGGMIPAPRGQAVNITAHGGERVVSDTGRGAPMGGGGGGTSNKYYFQTGVLTPDSQRTMIRQISRTQRSTGEKAFPQ